jgi:hypothetical protein
MARSHRRGVRGEARYGRQYDEAAGVRAGPDASLRAAACQSCGLQRGDRALFVFVLCDRGVPTPPPSCRCVHESRVG